MSLFAILILSASQQFVSLYTFRLCYSFCLLSLRCTRCGTQQTKQTEKNNTYEQYQSGTFFMYVFRMQFYFWELIIRFSIPRDTFFFSFRVRRQHLMREHCTRWVANTINKCVCVCVCCRHFVTWWRLKSYKIIKTLSLFWCTLLLQRWSCAPHCRSS